MRSCATGCTPLPCRRCSVTRVPVSSRPWATRSPPSRSVTTWCSRPRTAARAGSAGPGAWPIARTSSPRTSAVGAAMVRPLYPRTGNASPRTSSASPRSPPTPTWSRRAWSSSTERSRWSSWARSGAASRPARGRCSMSSGPNRGRHSWCSAPVRWVRQPSWPPGSLGARPSSQWTSTTLAWSWPLTSEPPTPSTAGRPMPWKNCAASPTGEG